MRRAATRTAARWTARLAMPLAAAALALGQPAPARAVVLDTMKLTANVTNLADIPVNFGIQVSNPAALNGPVQVTTYVIGVMADGARDGVNITLPGSSLVTGQMVSLGNPFNVTGLGGAASLAGIGGTAGQVFVHHAGVTAPGAPTNFAFGSGDQPLAPELDTETAHRVAVGYAIMDGGALDGVSLAGNLPTGAVAEFGVNGGTNLRAGTGASTPDVAVGNFAFTTGSVVCGLAPCTTANSLMDFQLSPLDMAVMLTRQELGGTEPTEDSDVVSLYALASDTQVFDCGVAGCEQQRIFLSFGLSGGDTAGFLVLQVISSVEPVPEPGTLALLGFGLAGLAAARRRAA